LWFFFFQDRVSWTIYLNWLGITILLIFTSLAARNYRCEPLVLCSQCLMNHFFLCFVLLLSFGQIYLLPFVQLPLIHLKIQSSSQYERMSILATRCFTSVYNFNLSKTECSIISSKHASFIYLFAQKCDWSLY
jgi:hypothetical protein